MTNPDKSENATRPHQSADAMPWVSHWLAQITPGGQVLDFAAGSGRHARLARDAGYAVVAADRNEAALADIGPGVQTVCTDLEAAAWPFQAASFDAVIVANYLFRPRLDLLCTLIRPGGWLIYQTFALGNARFGRPSNPDFLLMPGELLTLAARSGLTVAGYEHGETSRPAPAVVQRLAAWRPPGSNGPDGPDGPEEGLRWPALHPR